jgi:hypothetical protein
MAALKRRESAPLYGSGSDMCPPPPFRPAKEYMESKLLLTMAMRHLHAAIRGGNSSAGEFALSHSSSSSGDGGNGGSKGNYFRLPEVVTIDPGAVDSNLVRHWPCWLQWTFRVALRIFCLLNAPREAAVTVRALCLLTGASSLQDTDAENDDDADGSMKSRDEMVFQHWFNLKSRPVALPPSDAARSRGDCEEAWIQTRAAGLEFLRQASPLPCCPQPSASRGFR